MSQSEGPVYTMDELAEYFASPSPRKPLLNVVSLDLANTKLHDMVMYKTSCHGILDDRSVDMAYFMNH